MASVPVDDTVATSAPPVHGKLPAIVRFPNIPPPDSDEPADSVVAPLKNVNPALWLTAAFTAPLNVTQLPDAISGDDTAALNTVVPYGATVVPPNVQGIPTVTAPSSDTVPVPLTLPPVTPYAPEP